MAQIVRDAEIDVIGAFFPLPSSALRLTDTTRDTLGLLESDVHRIVGGNRDM